MILAPIASRSCSSGRSAPCRSTSTPTPLTRPTTCSKYRHHLLVPGTYLSPSSPTCCPPCPHRTWPFWPSSVTFWLFVRIHAALLSLAVCGCYPSTPDPCNPKLHSPSTTTDQLRRQCPFAACACFNTDVWRLNSLLCSPCSLPVSLSRLLLLPGRPEET